MQQPTHKILLQRCCPHPSHHSPALLPGGTDPVGSGRQSGEGVPGSDTPDPAHRSRTPLGSCPPPVTLPPRTVLLWECGVRCPRQLRSPRAPLPSGLVGKGGRGVGAGCRTLLDRFYFGNGLRQAPCGMAGETRFRNTIITVRGTPALPVSTGVRHPAAMIQGICRGTFHEFH